MMRTELCVVAAALMVLALAACGEGAAPASSSDPVAGATSSEPAASGVDGAAGICMEGASDCVDTPQLTSNEPVPIEEAAIEQFRRDARYYLGRGRDEVPDLVRIARLGNKQFAVTEDYRIGRITVELDDVESNSQPIVTSATVELPDGPETFELSD